MKASLIALSGLPIAPTDVLGADGQPCLGRFAGAVDCVDWSGLAAPYARSRVWRYFHHKRWQYVALSTEELFCGIAIVDLGWTNTAFAYAFALPLMIGISGWLTLAALLPFPFLFLAARRIGQRMYAKGRDLQESLGALTSALQEDLSGISVVKNYALEDVRATAFAAGSTRYLERSMAVTRARGSMTPNF